MSNRRLLAMLLTLVLALLASPVALAQEDEASTFDPATISEADQDEALILYLALRNRLLAAGVVEGDMSAAMEWLQAEGANLSEADVEGLLGAQMLAEETEAEMGDEEFGQAEEDEPGDDEFGQAEEDEPELGDEEEEE